MTGLASTPDTLRTAERAAHVVPAPAGGVLAVEAVGLTVSDLERAIYFYTELLDFTLADVVAVGGAALGALQGLAAPRARVARIRLGDEVLELTAYDEPAGRPAPADSRSNDRWFQHVAIIVSDIGRAWARLVAAGVVPISAGPQRLPDWNPNAGGIRAVYFRDPDGHPLELLEFPPDKGATRWHRPASEVFLGLDHTAIAVGDTAASLAFYRDLLGLAVAGRSENWGPEQERLNAVPGARLEITSVRAAGGPAIEFLHYHTPAGGRPIPPDERPSDLVHWQTTLRVTDVDRAAAALRRAGAAFVSAGVVEAPVRAGGRPARALLVRDPDGHVLQLVEAEPPAAHRSTTHPDSRRPEP